MPEILQFLSDWFNEGEKYEKLPRFIPYSALPIGMTMLTYRFISIAWQIATNQIDCMIASHEVKEELDELHHQDKENS